MTAIIDINDLKQKLTNLKIISWEDAFRIYKYDSGEFQKWDNRYDDKSMIKEHFQKYEKIFHKQDWFQGELVVRELLPVKMCLNTDWIRKIACSNKKCEFYHNNKCDSCYDPNESDTPTLEKVLTNFDDNMHAAKWRELYN